VRNSKSYSSIIFTAPTKKGKDQIFCPILWLVYQKSEKGLNPVTFSLDFFAKFSHSKVGVMELIDVQRTDELVAEELALR